MPRHEHDRDDRAAISEVRREVTNESDEIKVWREVLTLVGLLMAFSVVGGIAFGIANERRLNPLLQLVVIVASVYPIFWLIRRRVERLDRHRRSRR